MQYLKRMEQVGHKVVVTDRIADIVVREMRPLVPEGCRPAEHLEDFLPESKWHFLDHRGVKVNKGELHAVTH